jgi:hypothetical protein
MKKPLRIKHFGLGPGSYAQSYPQKMCRTGVESGASRLVLVTPGGRRGASVENPGFTAKTGTETGSAVFLLRAKKSL